jgi:hypothetical protein
MNKIYDCYGFGSPQGVLAKIIELTKEGVEIDLDKSHSSGFNNYHLYAEITKAKEETKVEENDVEKIEAEQEQEVSEVEVPEVEVSLEDVIKDLKTKKDCEAFAEAQDVEIPSDKKTVPVMKKWLKDRFI